MTVAGPMRQVVRIEQRSTTQDANGEPLTTWSLVGQRRAEKLQTPGRESWSAQERSGRIPTVFRLRYPDFAVSPQMRLTHDGKLYDIVSATDPTGRKVDLLLTCEEQTGEPIA